jgi:hypothetical protein
MIRTLIRTKCFGDNVLQLINQANSITGTIEYKYEYTDYQQQKIISVATYSEGTMRKIGRVDYETTKEGIVNRLCDLFDSLCEYYQLLYWNPSRWISFESSLSNDSDVEEIIDFIACGQLYHYASSVHNSSLYFYNSFNLEKINEDFIDVIKEVNQGKRLFIVERMEWNSYSQTNLVVFTPMIGDSWGEVRPHFIIHQDITTRTDLHKLIGRYSNIEMTPESIIKTFFKDEDEPFYPQYVSGFLSI